MNELQSCLPLGQQVDKTNLKDNQPWLFIGRTDAEADALIFWPPNAKNQLSGENPDAGKGWGQEKTGTTED